MAKTTKEASGNKAQDVLEEMLKDKSNHFNHITPKVYSVSTGSLNLDLEIGGGIKPCFIRVSGTAEAGKTSFALAVAKNHLESGKNRKAIYFVSDKDLSPELLKRCGITFVEVPEDFVAGTCFIVYTNVYETVCNTIKKILAKDSDSEYIFILDSMDNFAPKASYEVDFGESSQKGGISAISAHFFKTFSILLPKLGNIAILISQYRDNFQMGKGAPVFKQTNSSGGRAIEHAVTWAFEFQQAMNSKEDMFWEGEAYKSKKIGHNCIIQFKKSPNEKTGQKVKYPILYGRENGKAVWTEKELFDQMLFFQMIKLNGSWITLDAPIHAEIAKLDPDAPKQIQGEGKLVAYLTSQPKVTQFLYNKLRKLVSGAE
jgi:RecA/RadA recombinase